MKAILLAIFAVIIFLPCAQAKKYRFVGRYSQSAVETGHWKNIPDYRYDQSGHLTQITDHWYWISETIPAFSESAKVDLRLTLGMTEIKILYSHDGVANQEKLTCFWFKSGTAFFSRKDTINGVTTFEKGMSSSNRRSIRFIFADISSTDGISRLSGNLKFRGRRVSGVFRTDKWTATFSVRSRRK